METGSAELADAFVQRLKGTRAAAKKTIQDATTIRRLMGNFITLTVAGGGPAKQVSKAKRMDSGCAEVANECEAIISIIDKIVNSTDVVDKLDEVRSAVAKMCGHCAEAGSRIDEVEKMSLKVQAGELRMTVVGARVLDIVERLDGVMEKLEELGY